MKMKNAYYILTLIILSLTISSCEKSKEEVEADYIDGFISNLDVNEKFKWVVVLPGLGCHGCIQTAEAFMQENVTNEEILFVLTQTKSIKLLENKIDVKLSGRSNIYVDRERSFDLPSKNVIYPCIINVEKGVFLTHQFQSPSNEGFEKLEKKLQLSVLLGVNAE